MQLGSPDSSFRRMKAANDNQLPGSDSSFISFFILHLCVGPMVAAGLGMGLGALIETSPRNVFLGGLGALTVYVIGGAYFLLRKKD